MNDLLYGVVMWINDSPILDGMKYFETNEAALKYATEKEKLSSAHTQFKAQYTIIRLEKSI